MPDPGAIALFAAASLALAVVPGPAVLYIVAQSVPGGRRAGVASALGVSTGGLCHVVAAVIGLSALLAASAEAFTVVKLLGAAYLVYLGIRLLLAKAAFTTTRAKPTGAGRALREGVLVEALNVKTALFFLAFLPQFLVSGRSVVLQLVGMGTVCVVLNTLVDVAAVLGAARLLKSEASGRQRAKLLNNVSGLTLVGLGLYVATSKRGG